MSYVIPALAIGLGSINIKPKRGFYPVGLDPNASQPFVAHATIEELHHDELEISDHPVEFGATISDNAIKRPSEVMITCVWSNSPPGTSGLLGAAVGVASANSSIIGAIVGGLQTVSAAASMLSGAGPGQNNAVYQQLLQLQAARVPFDIYTGKRKYSNMLFKGLAVTTDAKNENTLRLTAICREVIIVSTQTVQIAVNAAAQAFPEKTSPTPYAGVKSLRSAPLGSGLYGIL